MGVGGGSNGGRGKGLLCGNAREHLSQMLTFLKGSRACPVVNAGDEMAVLDFLIWGFRGRMERLYLPGSQRYRKNNYTK